MDAQLPAFVILILDDIARMNLTQTLIALSVFVIAKANAICILVAFLITFVDSMRQSPIPHIECVWEQKQKRLKFTVNVAHKPHLRVSRDL